MKCLMADESMTGDDGVSDKVKRYLRRMYTELINISLERQNYKKILNNVCTTTALLALEITLSINSVAADMLSVCVRKGPFVMQLVIA